MNIDDFTAKKIFLMKSLWALSEAAKNDGMDNQAKMLEVAGNLVENSFCIGKVDDLILNAIE